MTPRLASVVLDTTDPRGLAEFYRQLLDLRYRAGDEPPADGAPDPAGTDWLVLQDDVAGWRLAFQGVPEQPRSTWPEPGVPQMLHLDTVVPDVAALEAARDQALALGATLLHDRSDDADEPLYVLADPAGHPFCVFVG